MKTSEIIKNRERDACGGRACERELLLEFLFFPPTVKVYLVFSKQKKIMVMCWICVAPNQDFSCVIF